MRFLAVIFFVMAIFALLCGIKNYNAAPVNLTDISLSQMLAVTNIN